jgi:hypothetical protein|nr:MAG TPA: Rad17 P-loop domain [Caudoviricetes sp.]
MNPVRIRFWLKNDEFLQASIDYDDVMAINEAYGKVKAGVVRNENLKITISNITFHVDDIAKASCWYGYLFADEPLSSVTIEERDVIKDELNKVYSKVDNFIKRTGERNLIVILAIILVFVTIFTVYQIYRLFSM